LADEINRAAPKVQSALLEAMQERQVTIGRQTFPLSAPFLVIATKNPVEQSGTFELPEAQLDRFMLCHRLDYPSTTEETEVVNRHLHMGLSRQGRAAIPNTAFDLIEREPVVTVDDLTNAMTAVQEVYVSEVFVDHCVELVRRTRVCPHVELGASPRAGISLVQASRARAFIHGRDHALPEDLFALASDVLLHRMRLTYQALADGRKAPDVLKEIMDSMG
jgi:MoxR-like ATPase